MGIKRTPRTKPIKLPGRFCLFLPVRRHPAPHPSPGLGSPTAELLVLPAGKAFPEVSHSSPQGISGSKQETHVNRGQSSKLTTIQALTSPRSPLALAQKNISQKP